MLSSLRKVLVAKILFLNKQTQQKQLIYKTFL